MDVPKKRFKEGTPLSLGSSIKVLSKVPETEGTKSLFCWNWDQIKRENENSIRDKKEGTKLFFSPKLVLTNCLFAWLTPLILLYLLIYIQWNIVKVIPSFCWMVLNFFSHFEISSQLGSKRGLKLKIGPKDKSDFTDNFYGQGNFKY